VPHPGTTGLEQAWNDFRTAFESDVPAGDEDLAALLAIAIRSCADELATVHRFEAEAVGRIIEVGYRASDGTPIQVLAGVCNANSRGGGLGRQVAEIIERAGRRIPILVRSTEFPINPKAAVTKQIGTMIASGGRRTVVSDPDWRVMLALPRFRAKHQHDPVLDAWLKESKPLTSLKPLRTILDLDRPPAASPPRTYAAAALSPGTMAANSAPPAKAQRTPAPEMSTAPVVLGTSSDQAAELVTMEPTELTRHAAFLGGTGSGKTTVALNLIEQLVLCGVPALLVDRKGDLCGYARREFWQRPLDDSGLDRRREELRVSVDVALYTPGNPQGRPLSIALAPPGLGQLGSFERGQVARYAAAALAGMMNYGPQNRSDQSRQAILTSAIDLLAQVSDDDTVSLGPLIEYIAEKDLGLVNAVGRLDVRLFDRLVNDLETLRLSRGEFLATQGEPVDPEALLGLGRYARPGRTRLSIISTRFLGATPDIQFWVSQLLVALGRWAGQSPAPSGRLQAVLLFDEADLYLPAQRQPPTKEPMENLLRRARSAGLGLLLATQSPGDFDYKCRDNIRAWFVGRVKEPTALSKMKPMLSACRLDVTARLPAQETGEFHLIRDGDVTGFRAAPALLVTEQLPEQEILELARATRGDG
jgi:DNA helicase HerA-like ATPase